MLTETALTQPGEGIKLSEIKHGGVGNSPWIAPHQNTNMKNKLAIVMLLAMGIFSSAQAFAGIQITVNIAPPPIVVFDQPACPGDGYIWTPGYYQYGDYGYYWVPGQWVMPPSVGVLWTPGYWGYEGRKYAWHEGYWGEKVGFYGGINYGNGYFGTGFKGGHWEGNVFQHNTAVSKVDHNNVHNTYVDRTVVQEIKGPNHAFNGKGGIKTQPTDEEVETGRAPHQAPTKEQVSQAQEAQNNHLAAHGNPRE